ncbi:MAG: cupin domain-containing protein [Bryobacteraceae bacterium]
MLPIRLAGCLALAAGLLPAQTLYAPKRPGGVYSAPHRPHTRLADLVKKHAGQAVWHEVIVDDDHLRSHYIQLKPGTRTPRALHPDTRAWWVVMDGEVRFDIETHTPFVAAKGSMVQVPMATLYSLEVLGTKPALIFETNIAGARTLYAAREDAPKLPGFDFIAVNYSRRPGVWGRANRPHVTFAEMADALESGRVTGTQRIVEDDRGAANFIYGYEKNLPPIDPKQKGHYHPECAEYWLIMKGQIRYPVEGQGIIIANEGDVVYVPKFTWHAPRWYGPGASCRLAMNGYPYIAHLFEGEAAQK